MFKKFDTDHSNNIYEYEFFVAISKCVKLSVE